MSGDGWDKKFAREPVLTSWSEGDLGIVRLELDASIQWQMLNQNEWYPEYDQWKKLGDPWSPQVAFAHDLDVGQSLLNGDDLDLGDGNKYEI